MNDRALNIKLPESLYAEIKMIAKSKNISLASLVRMVMTEYCNREGI